MIVSIDYRRLRLRSGAQKTSVRSLIEDQPPYVFGYIHVVLMRIPPQPFVVLLTELQCSEDNFIVPHAYHLYSTILCAREPVPFSASRMKSNSFSDQPAMMLVYLPLNCCVP